MESQNSAPTWLDKSKLFNKMPFILIHSQDILFWQARVRWQVAAMMCVKMAAPCYVKCATDQNTPVNIGLINAHWFTLHSITEDKW